MCAVDFSLSEVWKKMFIPASLFCQYSCQGMNENVQTIEFKLTEWMNWIYSLQNSEAQHKDVRWIHNTLHCLCCTQTDTFTLNYIYLTRRLCGFLSGWSVALVTPRCASGTLRQVSVYTSSWATWRRCAASSMTGGGWSAVPTTSWSKCGTPRQRPASIRCRATPTECTHYRWAASVTHSLVCGSCAIIIKECSRVGFTSNF